MPDRAQARRALLHSAGWGDAVPAFLAGDASDRTYDRLTLPGRTAVLMDAPPEKGDDPAVFLAVAAHLLNLGLSAPRLIASDIGNGFLVLEDFGDAVFARVLTADPVLEASLYMAAVQALDQLQKSPPMPDLPSLSAEEWAAAAAFALTHYRAAIIGAPVDQTVFLTCLSDLIEGENAMGNVMILRDFHAENLIWLPDRHGVARVGVLDFQLAQMGHPLYDVISLLQDARRDVQPVTDQRIRRHFCDARGMTEMAFETAAAVWGAQRALRILGVFTRLAVQSGKTSYLALMPRVWGHLQANLRHPALSPLQKICDALLPEPSSANLATIRHKAGR